MLFRGLVHKTFGFFSFVIYFSVCCLKSMATGKKKTNFHKYTN